jgi:hypothetical protein
MTLADLRKLLIRARDSAEISKDPSARVLAQKAFQFAAQGDNQTAASFARRSLRLGGDYGQTS